VNDRVIEKDWGADVRMLSAGAALIALTLWLDHMQVGAPNNISFFCAPNNIICSLCCI
jgi:hypothetical protein